MNVILGTVISMIGTMTGSLIGVSIRNPKKQFLGGLLGFAGGLMLSIVVFDLIPEAEKTFLFRNTVFFAILGIGIVAIFDSSSDKNDSIKSKSLKAAYLTAFGIMLHNFPEGIIMGCGFAAQKAVGLKMSLVIAVHDIPEGFAVAAPMIASNLKASKIILYSFITALPTAFGAILGFIIGESSGIFLNISLSMASGIMLYIVCGEMLPETTRTFDGITSTISVLAGIITGMVLIKYI